MSVAIKYIPAEAQKMMFGAKDSSITVPDLQPAATGLAYTGADEPSAVGCAFYAPDMIDGALKYTCVFIRRVIFGLPAMVYKTKGDSPYIPDAHDDWRVHGRPLLHAKPGRRSDR